MDCWETLAEREVTSIRTCSDLVVLDRVALRKSSRSRSLLGHPAEAVSMLWHSIGAGFRIVGFWQTYVVSLAVLARQCSDFGKG